MAKFDADISAFSRRDVLKVRRRVLLTHWKGRPLIKKWPRPRGKKKTPLQQVWVDWFSDAARGFKSPDPITYNAANYWAKGTGWYYRDVLENAAAGKLIRYQNEVKVRTPTAYVSRTATEAMTTNADKVLTPNAVTWDNNVFWSSTLNPSRLTVRSAGLYLVTALAHWTDFNTHFRYNWLKLNGSTLLAFNASAAGANLDFWANLIQVQYFHANDYIEVWGHSNSAGDHCQLAFFQLTAITPEALIP